MSKRDKILKKWETAEDERLETVEKMLEYFGFSNLSRKGSHLTYFHPALQKAFKRDPITLEDFGPQGFLTIPTKKGKTVKGIYLRFILKALKEIRKEEDLS